MSGYAHAGQRSGQPYRPAPDGRGYGALPQGKLVGPPDHASCGERAGRVTCHRSAWWRGHALAWWEVPPRPARAPVAPLAALINNYHWEKHHAGSERRLFMRDGALRIEGRTAGDRDMSLYA